MSRPVGVLLAAALASWAAVAPAATAQGDPPTRERTVAEDLQLFSQVLNQIRINHADELSSNALFMAAIEGLVRAADPHSYVLPARRLSPDRERAMRDGRLIPVPIAFRMIGGAHVVVAVHPGSRAGDSDILPGDELVAIDGEPFVANSTAELDILLAGPAGSSVRLGLERRRDDGSLARLERQVRRERLAPPSAVTAALLLDDTTGYLRVTTFAHDRVADDMRGALVDLERKGMRRLVLDLRDNGGGYLRDAAEIAGLFLPRGAVVYTTHGRKAEVTDTARVRRALWRSERDYPMVVLVNGGTASAAEVVAGALQDHDRAIVVGETTFGKALVMQAFPLTDGSLMVLVIGTVQTPCGRNVQREYRTISTRDYYRAQLQDRDRADRPSCITPAGRTVYGGGGIHPDMVLQAEGRPLWLARITEQDLVLGWAAGYADSQRQAIRQALTGPDTPTLPDDGIASFRAFAADQGAQIPDGEDVDDRLQRVLLPRLAYTLDGADAYFRAIARTDPKILTAARAFDPD